MHDVERDSYEQRLQAKDREIDDLRARVDRLEHMLAQMQLQLDAVLRENRDLRRENQELRRENQDLRKQLGRAKREDPPPDPAAPSPGASPQPEAPSQGPGPQPTGKPRPSPKEHRKKRRTYGRSAMPPDMERKEDLHGWGPCPSCGGTDPKQLREEVTEFYDYVPARLVIRRVIRPVCRCRDCQLISTAPQPDALAPRLRATPGLIALMIYEKFARYLPFYRVDRELLRLGLSIPEGTRTRWLEWAAGRLSLLLPSLKRALFSTGMVQTDGTGYWVVYGSGRRHCGQMAVYCNKVATIYDYSPDKSGKHQRIFLGLEDKNGNPPGEDVPRFSGFQVADAASVSDRTYAQGIVECGCNAHARRNFEEAVTCDERVAMEALSFWRRLYAVEADARELSYSERLSIRKLRSVPIVAELRSWLERQGSYLPKEKMSEALGYLRRQWDALFRYLEDGRIPIDNNLSERQVKSVVLGRKNYLFCGSDRAGGWAAVSFTFIATCAQHGVDAQAWMRDVLPRIQGTRLSAYDELLPHRWKHSAMRVAALECAAA